MKSILLLSLLLAPFYLQAENLNEQLLGKWELVNGTASMEFLRDGTVISAESITTMVGTYQFINDDRIKMIFDGFWGSLVGTKVPSIKITKKIMTLRYSDDTIFVYKKSDL